MVNFVLVPVARTSGSKLSRIVLQDSFPCMLIPEFSSKALRSAGCYGFQFTKSKGYGADAKGGLTIFGVPLNRKNSGQMSEVVLQAF